MILTNGRVPQTAQALSEVMSDLRAQPHVLLASLSTADGVPVDLTANKASQLSAVAGFLLAAAQQSCTMLGLEESAEVMIQGQKGHVLVMRPFTVAQTRVILTIIFSEETTYRRLFNTAVRAVQQVMEA